MAMIKQLLDRPAAVPLLVLAVSLGVLGTALASQYWGGLQPCVLCHYQRYAFVAAGGFGLLALVLAARPAARLAALGLAGLSFLTGAAIAVFHVGVEQQWWQGTDECYAPSLDANQSIEELREALLNTSFVSCADVPWSLFGISMAGYNVVVSILLGLATLWFVARSWNGARA